MSSNIKIEKICEFCSSIFTAQKTSTKFCSLKCSQRAYKERVRNAKIKNTNIQTSITISIPLEQVKSKTYLSIAETCLLVGVCRKTLYNLIQREELKAGKFGSRTIIRREDVDALIDKYHPPKTILK